MKPYENESEVLQIGDLVIENRTDRISIHGSLDITRDKVGQESANDLKKVVDTVVACLGGETLPEKIALSTPKSAKNPFR